jgi:hypothetical protein
VDDIVARGVGELRKSAFGEDVEDTKTMTWSREQVYYIIKQLSKTNEVCAIVLSGIWLRPFVVALLRRSCRLSVQRKRSGSQGP